MAAEHFKALVLQVQGDRSIPEIAQAGGIPAHWLQRPLKPSHVVGRVPAHAQLVGIAGALELPVERVRAAFVADLTGADTGPAMDAETQEALRLFAVLDPPARGTALAMLRSLGALQRQLGAPESEIQDRTG